MSNSKYSLVRMTTCRLTFIVYQSPRTRYLILYGSIPSVLIGSCCKRHQRCKLYSCITQHTKGLVPVVHRPLSHQTFRRCVSSLQPITGISFSDIFFQNFIKSSTFVRVSVWTGNFSSKGIIIENLLSYDSSFFLLQRSIRSRRRYLHHF